jgi:hypothetical protein
VHLRRTFGSHCREALHRDRERAEEATPDHNGLKPGLGKPLPALAATRGATRRVAGVRRDEPSARAFDELGDNERLLDHDEFGV